MPHYLFTRHAPAKSTAKIRRLIATPVDCLRLCHVLTWRTISWLCLFAYIHAADGEGHRGVFHDREACGLHHSFGDVHSCHLASRCDLLGDLDREVPRSAGHVKYLYRLVLVGYLTDGLLPPALVDIEGEDMIQFVIVRGDIVEQFPDSFFLLP